MNSPYSTSEERTYKATLLHFWVFGHLHSRKEKIYLKKLLWTLHVCPSVRISVLINHGLFWTKFGMMIHYDPSISQFWLYPKAPLPTVFIASGSQARSSPPASYSFAHQLICYRWKCCFCFLQAAIQIQIANYLLQKVCGFKCKSIFTLGSCTLLYMQTKKALWAVISVRPSVHMFVLWNHRTELDQI